MIEYAVHFFCDECGQTHPLGVSFALADGPIEMASIGDSYKGEELPAEVAIVEGNKTNCPETGVLTSQANNDQVFLVPMRFRGHKFTDNNIKVDGVAFADCRFRNCVMVYGGGPLPEIIGCSFDATSWTFSDQAENTVKFMTAIYHGMGDGGQQLIELTFDNIRKAVKPPVR